ncbi:MAG TPA: hypothetical protein VHV52_14180 [Gaiellaceae bacterium]|nr:hypothetical protein [Gaiellaceae bacterium]
MTATAKPSAPTVEAQPPAALDRADGVELLGDVHGSGYKEGAALVRRGDGQMVQLGPLMYALLETIDGRRSIDDLAAELSARTQRDFDTEHVVRLAEKLAAQGLLAGTEQHAPPRRNPLLALRFKVLVTNPKVTRWLTVPFTVLFRPFVLWPVVACFVAVFWFVLFRKGISSATSDAFHRPTLLLLVFALAVVSAGFHELGHAAACRYGGATPAGMGMGLYMVWPAFYTDVTDAYRLPRRDRLRVDLGGLYFNAIVAVGTMAAWLVWHVDALLLLVALQFLIMVKNLSPVIRSDGYHILADATGVPDLYAHIVPTLRRLIPGHRTEPSALGGRARLLVTLWVLIVVPVLLSMMLGAVLLLPRLATSAWDSGRQIAVVLPHDAAHGHVIALLVSLLRLVALVLPVLGSVLVAQRLLRGGTRRANAWSAGRPVRRAGVIGAAALAACGAAWAWWPAGQYQPVSAASAGTIASFGQLLATPTAAVRPPAQPASRLAPGKHLAVAMIPVGGATKEHPALFVIPGAHGKKAIAILSDSAPDPSTAPTFDPTGGTTSAQTSAPSTGTPATPTTSTSSATAFPFTLPSPPGPGDSQALAVGTKDGGVTYDVAYSLVTVRNGAPVTNTNSAFALASCNACTTVAVSFQIVLIIGESKDIAPINAAVAGNANCPACMTTAIAEQIVVTLVREPSQQLVNELEAQLKQLNALSALGANGTPAAVAADVADVQQQVVSELNSSGLLAHPISTTSAPTATATTTSASSTTPTTTSQGSTTPPATTTSPSTTATTPTTTAPTTTDEQTTPTTTEDETTTSSTTTDDTSTAATTTTSSSG